MFEFEYDDSEIPEEKKIRKVASEGKCYFVVESAELCISKTSGNEQCVYIINVTDDFGTTSKVWRYFPKKMSRPVQEIFKNFLTGCGQLSLFEQSKKQGSFDEQALVGCTGSCHVKHEYYKDELKAAIKFFYDKNEEPKAHHAQQAAKSKVEDDFDDLDNIPF